MRGCVLQENLRQFSASGSLDLFKAGVIARTRGLIHDRPRAEEGAMGELIDLAQRRAAVERTTRRREPLRAQLFFDLSCPFTYLATERVERAFSHVTWTAASSETLQRRCLADDAEGVELV